MTPKALDISCTTSVKASKVADIAKLQQWNGIAAVETESRGKIQFFLANEGRSSMSNHHHERGLV
jgi:hypothetical protein